MNNRIVTNPLRILHVVSGIGITGGVQSMLMNIYRNIDREKLQFDFVCYNILEDKKDSFHDEIKNLGGRVFYLSAPGKIGLRNFNKEFSNILLNEGPFQGVHSHVMYHNAIILKIAKKHNIDIRISHSHNAYLDRISLKKKLILNFAKYMISQNATTLVACGKEANLCLHNKSMPYHILPNAINVDEFNTIDESRVETLKKELNIPNEALVIGHIGRFTPQKNHEFMLRLMQEMIVINRNVILICVGDGKDLIKVKRKFKEANLDNNVRFVGARKDIKVLLNLFEVFILPSKFEGLPVVLIESQASNKYSIISSNITKEVDLGLGLIDFLSIDGDIAQWIKLILNAKNVMHPTFGEIRDIFMKKKYHVESNIEYLYKIYGLN